MDKQLTRDQQVNMQIIFFFISSFLLNVITYDGSQELVTVEF